MTSTNPSLSEPEQGKPANTRRDRAILCGLLLLFCLGMYGLARGTGWEETLAQLQKLTMAQVAGLLLLSGVNYGLRGLRWHLLARKLDLPLSVRTNLLHFIGGFAMSITPGRLGELVRLRWITNLTGWPVERLSPLPVADRAFDLAAMGGVLAAGLALASITVIGGLPVACVAIAAAIAVTRPTLLVRLIEILRSLTGRWPRQFARLRQAARSMGRFSELSTSLPALALSAVGWFAEGVALYLLLFWMGAEIDLATAVVIFIFATLAGGLTGAPGGLGGAEAAMVLLLSLKGVPLAVSIPATAVIRLTTLWFAIGIGIVAFPLAEKSSRRAAQ